MSHDLSMHLNKSEGLKILIRDVHALGVDKDVLLTISGIIVLAPLWCNGVVLLTYFKFKCLRRIHDKLAVNLALVNIITALGIPFYMSNTTFPLSVWTDKYLCLSHYIIFLGGILSSMFIILGLAFERYVCIVYPLRYRRLRCRYIVLWIIMSYVVGFGFYCTPILGWNNWDEHQICTEEVFPEAAKTLYEIVISSILFINAFIHLCVFKIAVAQSKKISLLVWNVRRRQHPKKKFRSKAFTTVFILAVASTISWIPQLVVYVFLRYNHRQIDVFEAEIFVEISYIPVLINTTLSPMIFAYRNRHFRDAVRSLLHCRRHTCQS